MASGPFLHEVPGQHVYDGVVLGKVYVPAILDQVKKFEFDPSDVLLVGYPKGGRLWLEEATWLIQNDANFSEAAKMNVRGRVLPIEISAPGMQPCLEKLQTMSSPRLMATFMYHHFYEESIRKANNKVIIIMRNPKDALVAYYHFYRMCGVTGYYDGSWAEFFQIAKAKQLNLGDWFDHVLGWYKPNKDKTNFLFVKYEDMVEDGYSQVKKISEFLGKSHSDKTLREIAEHCSFEHMKENPTTNMEDVPAYDHKISPFLRKGVVGDWKNYFTAKQREDFDKMYETKVLPAGLSFRFE